MVSEGANSPQSSACEDSVTSVYLPTDSTLAPVFARLAVTFLAFWMLSHPVAALGHVPSPVAHTRR